MSGSEFKQIMSDTPLPEKKVILAYMRSIPHNMFTSEPVRDKLSDEVVFEVNNGRNDGKYTWYESDIYHFEKYNIKISDDFINYVLSK